MVIYHNIVKCKGAALWNFILIKFYASEVFFTFDFIEENLVVDILVGFHNSDFRAIATKNLRIL